MSDTTTTDSNVPNIFTNSLYVGELPQGIMEDALRAHFSEHNPFSSKVCRDKVTSKSLGYGYVNFNTKEEAYNAFKALNFRPIEGYEKKLRISPVVKDPSMRKNSELNLFIRNLPENFTSFHLWKLFQEQGVISCRVPKVDGKHLSHGYLAFAQAEDAKRALETFHKKQLGDTVLELEQYKVKPDKKNAPFTNVFVGGAKLTLEESNKLFGKWGEVNSIYTPDSDNKLFSAVNFAKFEDAQNFVDDAKALQDKGSSFVLIREGDDLRIESREQADSENVTELRVERFTKRSDFLKNREKELKNNPDRSVYVKNFGTIDGFDEDKLREIFADCGEIESVKVMRNEQGISRGFGFVNFKNKDSATKALSKHNIRVQSIPLYVSDPKTKEERMALAQRERERQMPQVSPFYGMPTNFVNPTMVQPQQMNYIPDFEQQLSASNFESMEEEEQKKFLGNYMYHVGQNWVHPNYLGIIIGALLKDFPVSSLLELVRSPEKYYQQLKLQEQAVMESIRQQQQQAQ